MIRRYSNAQIFVFFISWCLIVTPAASDSLTRLASELDDIEQMVGSLGMRFLQKGGFRSRHYVEERLIDGENFYRMKDYTRAAIILLDIIENYPNHAAYTDAVFLFADSLFMSGDYTGSKNWFEKLLEHAGASLGSGKRFYKKAVGRLIEIAIHLDDYKGVEEYFVGFGQVLDDEARYIKGKYLYFKGDLDSAKSMLQLVSGDKLLWLKSQYFIGAILSIQRRINDALEVFNKSRAYMVQSMDEQEIVDLLNLGAGRLYQEKGFVENASECYQQVSSNSRYFDVALYEAASVLVKAGDTIRAARTLEVLTLAVPDSKYIPKAKLLRGNLLLRTGRYEEAEKLFDGMIEELTPVLNEFKRLISDNSDPGRFFADLVSSSMTSLDTSTVLPPLVVKWVSEEEEVQRALDLADNLGIARGYAKETHRLLGLLEAVVNGSNQINAFPILRDGKRHSQGLKNRLGQVRFELIKILADKLDGGNSKTVQLIKEIKSLEKDVSKLPVNKEEFKKRDAKARQIFKRMSHEMSRNQIRADRLFAMIVAIGHFINDDRYVKGIDEGSVKTVRDELDRHAVAVKKMRIEIEEVKRDVEREKYQIGIGDSLDQNDESLFEKIENIFQRTAALTSGSNSKSVRRINLLNGVIAQVQTKVDRFSQAVSTEAVKNIGVIEAQLKSEKANMARYNSELGQLGGEAEEVVGQVALENFSNVRERFFSLILKADVGIIDVVWLRKEEHSMRIKSLSMERSEKMNNLNTEFQELKKMENSRSSQ